VPSREADYEKENALEQLQSESGDTLYRAHRRDTGAALEPLMTIEELYEWSGTLANAYEIIEGKHPKYYLTVEQK
jgi:hypothetical protein